VILLSTDFEVKQNLQQRVKMLLCSI